MPRCSTTLGRFSVYWFHSRLGLPFTAFVLLEPLRISAYRPFGGSLARGPSPLAGPSADTKLPRSVG